MSHEDAFLDDLLGSLPEVFAAHVFPLLPPEACGHLRLAYRKGKRSADLLTTSVCVGQSLSGEDTITAATQLSWHQAIDLLPPYLARLPSLTSLKLQGWSDEAQLASGLLVCGRALPDSRMRKLVLSGGWLTVAGMRAVPLAFPGGLAELHLVDIMATRGADEEQGATLLPLQALRLGKLSMTLSFDQIFRRPNVAIPEDALWGLGQLTTLHTLHLSLYTVHPPDMHLLGSLVNLHTCAIEFFDAHLTLVDVAALFAATGLTSLHLRDVQEDGTVDHPPTVVAAALSQLGALTHLRSLYLGYRCVLTDNAFAAVARLGQLTELWCGGVLLAAATPATPAASGCGVLPLLQRLRTCSEEDEPQRPSHLLGTLQPFLPLPSLTSLDNGAVKLLISQAYAGAAAADPAGGVAAAAAAAAAAQSAELQALVRLLAAAPRLQLPDGLHLAGDPSEPLLTAADVGPVLQPLLSRLSCPVTLIRLAPGPEPQWGALLGTLPGLEYLNLEDCPGVTGAQLACLVRRLPALRHLGLRYCDVGSDELAELAEACDQPLELDVWPRAEAAVVARCRARQRRVHDAQHITWKLREGSVAGYGSDTDECADMWL